MLIDQYLPYYDVSDVNFVVVSAAPAQVYDLVRHVDLYRAPVIRVLFWLRTLPERLLRSKESAQRTRSSTLTIDDIVAPGSGFIVLSENPGEEIVIGAVGKFWQPRLEFVNVDAADFSGFETSGYAKLAWNICVQPYGSERSLVSVEARVKAIDEASRRRFRLYWKLIGPVSRWIRRRGLALIVADAAKLT